MARGSNTYGADGNIVIGTSVDVGGINTGLYRIEKSFKRLERITGGVLSAMGLVKFGKQALEAASDLQEVQNIVDVTFGEMEYKVEKFASTCIETFGMSELAAKQTAGSFMAMGNAMGMNKEDASNMAIQLTALTGDMASFYNISQDYARVALSAVYTGETETLKRYGIVLTEANLQQYALSQGIATSIHNMSAQEKAMLRYNYIMQATKDIQGDFVRTQDTWANQVRVLQQRWTQFMIVLGKGLITVLTPMVKVLNTLVQALTVFARKLGAIIANIFGLKIQDLADSTNESIGGIADSAKDAADATSDLANATQKAGKAAKNALSPLDELNVITQDQADSSSGSGSGGAGAGGGAGIGDITEGLSLMDKIQDKFKSDIDNLYGLGKYLSDTLRNMLLGIDWDYIYQGAINFGTGLADFLNGLFQPETFFVVGQTIANSLNTVIYAALAFGKEFDWANFGLSLAEGVNGFFENFDFASLADAIDAWVQGVYTTITTFIEEVDWGKVWDGAKEFLTNIDLDTIEIIVGALVIKKIAGLAFGFDFATWAGTAIAKPLGEAVWLGLSGQIAVIAGEGAGMAEAFTAVFGSIGPAVQMISGSIGIIAGFIITVTNFVDMLKDGFSWLNELFMLIGTAVGSLGLAITGIVTGPAAAFIGLIIGGALTAIVAFVDQLKDGFSWFKELLMIIGTVAAAVGAVLLGIVTGPVAAIVAAIIIAVTTIVVLVKEHWDEICEVLGTVADWFDTNIITPVSDFISNLVATIVQWATETYNKIMKIINPIVAFIMNNIINPIKSAIDFFKQWVSAIVANIIEIIKAIIIVITDWVDRNIITPIRTAIDLFLNVVVNWVKEKWENIKTTLAIIAGWFSTNVISPIANLINSLVGIVKSVWSQIKNVIQKVKDFVNQYVIQPISNLFSGLWDAITGGIKGAINACFGVIEKFVNGVIDVLNTFTSGLGTIGKWAAKITGNDDLATIGKIPKVSIPRLAKGAVIPPNNEFMAILGDQKRGTNIEAPLETIQDAVALVLTPYLQRLVNIAEDINDKDFATYIGDKEIAQAAVRGQRQLGASIRKL